jgi:hypothetical protein
MFNILYKKKIIERNLTEEQCSDVLFDLAQKSYDGEIDANEIELEEIKE